MSKRKCRIKVMKEHSPIKNQLKTYMLWPLVMVGFMILANISVALIDRRAGAAMGGFTFAGVILTIWHIRNTYEHADAAAAQAA